MFHKNRIYISLIILCFIFGSIGIFFFLQKEKNIEKKQETFQAQKKEETAKITTSTIAGEQESENIVSSKPTKEKDEIIHVTTTSSVIPVIEQKSIFGFIGSLSGKIIRVKSALTTAAQKEYVVEVNEKTQIVEYFKDSKTNTTNNKAISFSDLKKDMPVNIFSSNDLSKKNIIATKVEYYSE